ncbi:hypothetical protein BY996DRAFT_6510205 [Phakopsora pachyrhizi]|nr:hypothetical protein BY996DRAFT_6510205 [Phakopsora pachyrhizi]
MFWHAHVGRRLQRDVEILGIRIDASRDRCGKLPKADQAGLGRVGTAGRAMGRAILQGRRRKGLYGDTIAGPTKARMRFGGIKIVRRIRKPWEGKRPEEVSVGLVRRRAARKSGKGESRRPKRRTDIWGISKAVVGRAVREDCRRARRRHTEVRSSYHFRVRTEVNSTTADVKATIFDLLSRKNTQPHPLRE